MYMYSHYYIIVPDTPNIKRLADLQNHRLRYSGIYRFPPLSSGRYVQTVELIYEALLWNSRYVSIYRIYVQLLGSR